MITHFLYNAMFITTYMFKIHIISIEKEIQSYKLMHLNVLLKSEFDIFHFQFFFFLGHIFLFMCICYVEQILECPKKC